MPEHHAEAEQNLEAEPSYEVLAVLVASQRKTIAQLNETVAGQAALISELEKAAASGRRWTIKRTLGTTPTYAGLGARVEAILGLAQDEVEILRTEAENSAESIIASAKRDAERIRAEARGETAQP